MKKMQQLYEGKAKKVFATDDPNLYIVDYKDDATAFNGLKKGTIQGKGVINNTMTNHLMQYLEKNGIPTHFVEQISDRPHRGDCPEHCRRFPVQAAGHPRGNQAAEHRPGVQL